MEAEYKAREVVLFLQGSEKHIHGPHIWDAMMIYDEMLWCNPLQKPILFSLEGPGLESLELNFMNCQVRCSARKRKNSNTEKRPAKHKVFMIW